MIGVSASAADLCVAAEFFELFKTAWEPAVPGRVYDAVVATDGRGEDFDTDLLLVYGSAVSPLDPEASSHRSGVEASWNGLSFPLFGAVALFATGSNGDIAVAEWSVDVEYRIGTRRVRRIGYDLFAEIHSLLTTGQPAVFAQVPTLELHIALMRHWLVQADVPFVEILPRPAGHSFICCLTHDVDFFGVRRQGLDRTTAGFAVRASLGTIGDLLRRRRTWREAMGNFTALAQLPFVLLGLARDFWRPFDDYAACERPERSTFFLVPFKDRAGIAPDGSTQAARAVRYQASDIAAPARQALARGSELGVHGIDAWQGAGAADRERQ